MSVDLDRAEALARMCALAGNPDYWEVGDALTALVSRVRDLTEAGNRLVELIDHPENHGQDWHNDARWAADAWRPLTEERRS